MGSTTPRIDLSTALRGPGTPDPKTFEKLTATLEAMTSGSADMNRELRRTFDTLSDITDQISDAEEALQTLQKASRTLRQEGMFPDDMSQEAAKKRLKTLKETAEAVTKLNKEAGNNQGVKAAQAYLKELEKIDKRLDEAADGAKDFGAIMTKGMSAATRALHGVEGQLVHMTKAMSEFRKARDAAFSPISDPHLTKMVNLSKFFSSAANVGKVFAQGKGNQLLAKAQERKQSASVTRQEIAAKYQSDPRGVAVMMGGDNGFFRKIYARRAANEFIEGKNPGIITRLALQGGGSVTKGLGGLLSGAGSSLLGGALKGAGGIAGAIGGGMGALGKLTGGPWGMALGALQAIVDKGAEQNQAVDSLAGGGIYAGNGPGSNIQSYRRFANGGKWGDFGMQMYGQTFEKNIEVMKSMIESGRALSDDMKTTGFGDSIRDFQSGKNMGTTGAVFQNATFGARNLGITQDAATQLTIKLIDKYQQSAKDTVNFFSQVSKESKIAGLSTSKYIDVISSLVDQMDGLDKSFQAIVLTVEKLGKSGRFSAEQLKDMGTFLGGGAKGQSTEALAYILGKEGSASGAKAARTGMDAANLQLAGLDLTDAEFKSLGLGDKSFDGKSLGSVKAQLNASNMDVQKKKELQGILKQYEGNRDIYSLLSSGANNATMALGLQNLGETFSGNVVQKMNGLRAAMRSSGISEQTFMTNPGAALAAKPQLGGILKMLGYDPIQAQNFMQDTYGTMAQSSAMAMKGDSENSRKDRSQFLTQMPKTVLKHLGLTGADADARLKAMDPAKIAEALMGETKILGDMFTNSTEANRILAKMDAAAAARDQAEKGKKAEELTAKTADVFARSFEHLFRWIFEPMNALRNLFVRKDGNDREKAQSAASWMLTPEMKRYAQSNFEARMNQLNADEAKEKEGKSKEEQDKIAKKYKAKRDKLAEANNLFQNATQESINSFRDYYQTENAFKYTRGDRTIKSSDGKRDIDREQIWNKEEAESLDRVTKGAEHLTLKLGESDEQVANHKKSLDALSPEERATIMANEVNALDKYLGIDGSIKNDGTHFYQDIDSSDLGVMEKLLARVPDIGTLYKDPGGHGGRIIYNTTINTSQFQALAAASGVQTSSETVTPADAPTK
jgi:uncharacterized protein YaiI (UPF0178 family)